MDLSWNARFLKMWRLFLKILKKVDHMHREGLTHGDLKGDNIMTHNDGNENVIRLLDLGHSKFMDVDKPWKSSTHPSYVTFRVTETPDSDQEEDDDENSDGDDENSDSDDENS